MPQSLNEGEVSGDQSNASCRTVVFVRMAIVRPSSFRMRRQLHSGVHRRQSILPSSKENRWRPHLREYTRSAFAVSSPPQETNPSESVSCNRSRPIKNQLLTMVRSRHVASTLLRSARQPFRWSLCARHHPLTRSRHPTALPVCRSIPAETSVAGFIDFYSGHTPPLRRFNHVTDRVTHRVPTRLPQRFLR